MEKYIPTIGLEIHVELNTKSKMFCGSPNNPDEKQPNTNVCPVCMGHPGTLPVINQEAVKKVIKTGLALSCQIPENSKFDRKNYFYPDLPKGYQISQYDLPLCKEGFLKIKERKIRIRRVHLEEDTGRLLHPEGKDYSLVDFNRAGVPLMELVTEPDIESAVEAKNFAEELQLILRYLGVSTADMEKGQMRVEVNLSLSEDKNKLGTKVEIKNLNSFRSVERGITYEIERQKKLLSAGKKIIQETRGWSDQKEETFSQREKEEAHDYRYFPEPDLPPLHFTKDQIDRIRGEVPELPQQRKARLMREYSLDEKSAAIFVNHKDLGEFFEKVVSEFPPNLSPEDLSGLIKLAMNYLISDLLGLLKQVSITDKDFLVTPENFAEFIVLIYKGMNPKFNTNIIMEGAISSASAKVVLKEMFETGADPSHIVEEKGLSQTSDEEEIEKAVQKVILANQGAVEDYKRGKSNAFQFLVGKVMADTRGKANPQIVGKLLEKTLTSGK